MITESGLEQQTCRVEMAGEVGTIHLPSFLTVMEAVAFKQAFQDCCHHNPDMKRAVVDFTATRFIDSSGIGALVNVWKVSQSHSLEFSLRNVASQVMMALSLAGLDTLFDIQVVDEPSVSPMAMTTPPSSKPVNNAPIVTHPSVASKIKRLIDIVGAIVGLSITAFLFIPIAIAIQLDDPGPIFFSQTRCSLMARKFRIWKFRSMVADAEKLKHKINNQFADGRISKDENDPRITRVGRFLRKTSLDEFPQFWNVLKGEMSLVGTRPPTPDEVEQYEIPEWQRLDVKPGLTGEWQVNGRSSITTFEDIIRLDLQYQERWSLLYDIKLIFKTIWVIFDKKSGAM
ncbi:MAG: sugar transferase [Leptolyngbyaceae cyanobacterium]